jgi:hypothetical protein
MSSGTNLGATIRHAVAACWRGSGGQARIDQPSGRVLDHTLADAVLCRADSSSAREQVRRDMLCMMQRFSIDPEHVPAGYRQALRDAEQVCARCLAVSRCQLLLYGQLSEDVPRSFCPSAGLYDEIALAQQQARAARDERATA